MVRTYHYDIDTKDGLDNTALSLMVTSPCEEELKAKSIQFLLELGADPTLKVGHKQVSVIELAKTQKIREVLLRSEKAADLYKEYVNKPLLPESEPKIIIPPKTASTTEANGFFANFNSLLTNLNQVFSKQPAGYQRLNMTDDSPGSKKPFEASTNRPR